MDHKQWLGARLEAMRRLAESLEQANDALLRRDVEAILSRAEHQLRLCEEIRELDQRGAGMPKQAEENQPVIREVGAAEARVRYANRVQAALVKHGAQWLQVLARIVDSADLTYAPPQINRGPR